MTKQKQPKPLNFIINGTVYNFYTMFSIGQTKEELLRSLKKWSAFDIKEIEDYNFDDADGLCFKQKTNNIIVWVRYYPRTAKQFAVLQHEIFHSMCDIMSYICGIPLTRETEEAYAHYLTWITREVYQKILPTK